MDSDTLIQLPRLGQRRGARTGDRDPVRRLPACQRARVGADCRVTHAIPPAHRLAVAYDAEGWPWRIDVRPPDRRRVFLGLGPLAAPLPAVHLNAVASLPVYFAEHPDHLALAGLAAGLVLVTDPPSYDGGR